VFASITPFYQGKKKTGPLQQKFLWPVLIRMPIKRCSTLLTIFLPGLHFMAHREHPEDFNAFGYDPRGQVANIVGLMFGEKIGALTSNISLATMAPRSHHLDTDHLQNISALTSPTTLFPIFLDAVENQHMMKDKIIY
jgi:hypothetical protein